jgi:hypothetical protein
VPTPRPDHPWYGRKNHVQRRVRTSRDVLIDQEIERAWTVEQKVFDDLNDLEGDNRPAKDPSYEALYDGGLRRVPVRYDID